MSIHDAPLINYPRLIATLVRQRTLKITKRDLQEKGIALGQLAPYQVRMLAEAYFESHRAELIRVACDTVLTADRLRRLAESEAQRRTKAHDALIVQHRSAVIVLAMQRAKRLVQANIRAKGQRLADFSAKEITLLAEDYLAQHGPELMAEAEEVIATSPGFERWRLPVPQTDSAKTAAGAMLLRSDRSSLTLRHPRQCSLQTYIVWGKGKAVGVSCGRRLCCV